MPFILNQMRKLEAAAPPGGLTVTQISDAEDMSAGSTSRSVTGLAIGAAAADRRVYICVSYYRNDGAPNITAGDINGVPISIDADSGAASATRMGSAIVSALVPAGTTADVNLTFDANVQETQFISYRVTGVLATPHDVAFIPIESNTIPLNVNTVSGGAVIGTTSHRLGAGRSVTPTGLTEDIIMQKVRGTWAGHAADVAAETPRTVSLVWSSSQESGGAAVSLAPA